MKNEYKYMKSDQVKHPDFIIKQGVLLILNVVLFQSKSKQI